MTPEEAIAAQLDRRLGSLSPGTRHPIQLERVVYDGVRWRPGPHPVGWLAVSPGGLKIRLVPTAAGRTARALLEEDLLDIVLTGYPAVIRLTALGR